MLKKILLADDSLTIQKVVELTFTEEDFEVIVVGDGAQAIQRIGTDRPDLVLADVLMPKKTGYEVCEFVKSNPGTRHVPVLLLVGKFEPFDEERARKAGADGHILKPFESAVLVRRVTELLSAAQRAALGSEVTSQAAARAPALPRPVEPVTLPASGPAASPLGIPVLNQTSPIHSRSNDTAEVERPTEPTPAAAEAAPYAPEPFADKAHSLLDDEEPLVPSGYAEPAPFGEEPQPSPFDEPAPFAAPLEPAPTAFPDPAPSFAASAGAPAFAPTAEPASFEPEAPGVLPAAGAVPPAADIDLGDFPQEVIDAIARRVLQRMSEDVVRDIVWQVVPDLAELMIKKKLEELGS